MMFAVGLARPGAVLAHQHPAGQRGSAPADADPAERLRTWCGSAPGERAARPIAYAHEAPDPVRGFSIPGRAAHHVTRRDGAAAAARAARRQVRLQAGDAGRPDDRVVARPGRQLEPVAGRELDVSPRPGQPERDRAARDDDDLVVAVLVRRVPVARPVRPEAGSRPSARSRSRSVRLVAHAVSPRPRRR